MDGIINILKPPGMTSHDVVAFIRRLLKVKKVGHTGTLDPGAAGVLPICIGKATKAANMIMEKDKVYRAEMFFGITTDSQDSYGQVLSTEQPYFTKNQLLAVLEEFTGHIEQIPPMYSAVKVDGKKLYELARKGIEVERKPRPVHIKSISIVHDLLPNRVIVDIHCSRGTYVRTLCHDIGQKLGCGAYMSFLIRTRSGNFLIDNSTTLEELIDMANQDITSLYSKMTSIDEFLLQE